MNAEDPWQCLATCFELTAALRSEDPTAYVCNLPVHQDGSCNGLQHYAALGGDIEGAIQVNLEPADRPQDVYSRVAELVAADIERQALEGNQIAIALRGKITRKIVKQTVMTSVYGVTFVGAKAQIFRALKDKGDLETHLLGVYPTEYLINVSPPRTSSPVQRSAPSKICSKGPMKFKNGLKNAQNESLNLWDPKTFSKTNQKNRYPFSLPLSGQVPSVSQSVNLIANWNSKVFRH